MEPYYIDLGYKDVRIGMYDRFDFDKDGIPRYPYPHPSGMRYNITFICHYALYHHALHVKFGRQRDLEIFLNVCAWILEHGEETDDSFLCPYSFPFGGLSPPWISALGQGRMLSVLARAYKFSGEDRYLTAARKAMKPFELAVSEGGVQARFPDGGIGFEEYPLRAPNLVLNGFITSLVGLYDLGATGQAERASELFMQGILSLEKNLHRYELGHWSAYDLTGYIASPNYHLYHIMQLWALYEMTGYETFKKTSSKWQSYSKGARFRVAYLVTRGRKWVRQQIR